MSSAPKRRLDPASQVSPVSLTADRLRQSALALQKQGRLDEAIHLYRRGLLIDPKDVSSYRCLGTAYKAQGRLDHAAACFRRAVELCPAFPEAWNNLGNTLTEQGDFEGAAESFRHAFEVQPHFAGAHFNYAQAAGRLGRFDEAIAECRRAVDLAPRSAEFYNGLGMALYDALRIDEAIAAYGKALELRPDFASARYNRGHAWLLSGDYARGWGDYESRCCLPGVPGPPFTAPRWDGAPSSSCTLLLEAEQGLGDTIQFVRYIRLTRQRVGRLILRCQPPLKPLLQSLSGVDLLLTREEPAPPFDCWLPLMSLGNVFSRSLDSVPNRVPYLEAQPSLVNFWQERMRTIEGVRVGINWQGNPAFPKDRFRSIPLAEFQPLARIAGVRLVSLQKGAGTEQLGLPRSFPIVDLGLKLDEIHGPFIDTAAILQCIDLVITSDTALAHLSGAMGVETWLAVPRVPEWRWLLHRSDSPWYPTLRLFRQRCVGRWDDVFASMAEQLRARMAARQSTA